MSPRERIRAAERKRTAKGLVAELGADGLVYITDRGVPVAFMTVEAYERLSTSK